MNPSDDRVTRLEEALAFNERAVEQMHGEIIALHRRVEALSVRLDRAENALSQKADTRDEARDGVSPAAPSGIELPPHAHRPVDRDAGRTNDPFAPTTPPPDTLLRGDEGRG